MNKLKLDVEGLEIESFEPDASGPAAGGTVEGASIDPVLIMYITNYYSCFNWCIVYAE